MRQRVTPSMESDVGGKQRGKKRDILRKMCDGFHVLSFFLNHSD